MYTYVRQPEKEKKAGFTGYMVDEASTIKSYQYNNIYRSKAFQEAMNYFDITDDMTRGILLTVNEADQNAVMVSLSNKLYKHIVDKIDDIDFGTLPQSKGDITKIENYEEMVDCLNVINDILVNYNQPTGPVDTVRTAINNMVDRTSTFTRAYEMNVEMPIIIYNTIVLAIVSSVSYLISTTIEFIKLPQDQGYEIALDKNAAMKTNSHLLYKDLEKFNKSCANGELDKMLEFVMKQNASNFGGETLMFGAMYTAAALGVIILIIPVIRELIFFFYYIRAKLSDYFDAQSTILTMNAYNIENNLTRDSKTRKDIAKKQKNIAEKFKKISNFFKIQYKSAEKKTTDNVKKLDKEKYKASDILDSTPDSATAALF